MAYLSLTYNGVFSILPSHEKQILIKKPTHAEVALVFDTHLSAVGFQERAHMSALPVSVVIPALNEESCIARCLVSVLDQDFPRDQMDVVVVDNGSTDATASIARQFPVRVVEESRSGVAKARNAGIRAARGRDSRLPRRGLRSETGLASRTALGFG